MLQHFDRCSHGADDAATNNALDQLQVMKAENAHALIEVKQTFGNIVQCEELFMPAVDVIHREVGPLQLIIESLPQTRAMCSKARNPGESRPLPWPSPARIKW